MNVLRTEQGGLRAEEARVYYYLQQWVADREGDDLQSLLQFATGSVDMPRSGIVVIFLQTVATARNVVAHMSSNSLHLWCPQLTPVFMSFSAKSYSITAASSSR